MTLLLQFFLAHILGDFFLQPNHWVHKKKQKKFRSPFLYLHAAVHFVLVLVIAGNFLFWKQNNTFYALPALMIAISHLVIDGIKLQCQNAQTERAWFFVDQSLHILCLVIAWAIVNPVPIDWTLLSQPSVLVVATAILLLLQPAAFVIRMVITKWNPAGPEIHGQNSNETSSRLSAASGDTPASHTYGQPASLENAGLVIGILERLLVFAFIMLDRWEGVGFLLAAKSVFRFGDLKEAKEMKLTEYVLIGTLLSFGIAIAVALGARALLR